MKSYLKRLKLWHWILSVGSICLLSLIIATAYTWYKLPSLDDLTLSQLKSPLRIYTVDKKLMAVFGEVRRETIPFDDIPETLVSAILAAEDDEFFEHSGVDYKGMLRAFYHLLLDHRFSQGGSTITMQLARNFYLSHEKRLSRKFKEILLAWKIENRLTKQQILALYINKIYLGNRAYGFSAASQVYYGKALAELSIPQFAMLASLPKAPSTINPVANPERSLQRRNYVLRRMQELNLLDSEAYQQAVAFKENANLHGLHIEVDAPYVAEMARLEIEQKFGQEVYEKGYNVYTTIDATLQQTANKALRKNLQGYDQRHGYRGPLAKINIIEINSEELWLAELSEYQKAGHLVPGLVVEIKPKKAKVFSQDGKLITITQEGVEWINRYRGVSHSSQDIDPIKNALAEGDVIYLEEHNGEYYVDQLPQVQGALVSVDPRSGGIRVMVGGHTYSLNRFNHVTQARRQPGSSFKPFIYSAALEKGFTAATIVNDAPIVKQAGQDIQWTPDNDGSKYLGPIRLRYALAKSRNVVAIRVLEEIGLSHALDHVAKFGFAKETFPRNLTLALGSGEVTPLELARGYAVFANGGYLISPYLIDRVEDRHGKVVYKRFESTFCDSCTQSNQSVTLAPRVITSQNAFIMANMMKDVIDYGTAKRARELKRHDLAGKTGTTNDQRDAWFAGFHPSLVTVAWVGFDNPQSLGRGEYGGRTALPMWIDVMGAALANVPEAHIDLPGNMVNIKIDKQTGLLSCDQGNDVMFEIFRAGHVPEKGQCHAIEEDPEIF